MVSDHIPQSSVAKVLEALDLAGLRVAVSAVDAARMEQAPGCLVAFPEALRQALQAFLTNRQGSSASANDAPSGLLFEVPEAHGLPEDPDGDQVAQALRSYLKEDAEAEIVLLTPSTIQEERYRFTPEYGEDLGVNWVFRIRMPRTFDVLTWAIVDTTGRRPAYAYCVE